MTKLKFSQITILVFTFLVTVTISPITSFDAINVPRLSILIIFGFISLALLPYEGINLSDKQRLLIYLICIGFVVWLTFSLFISKINFIEGIYGVTGRQTGLLTYASLTLVLLLYFEFSDATLINQLLFVLKSSGLIAAIYGLIQFLGHDPFKWDNPFGPVIGLLGNPNFHSSFMGIYGVAIFSSLLMSKVSILLRLFYCIQFGLIIFNLMHSGSQQGYLVLGIGSILTCFIALGNQTRLKMFSDPKLVGSVFSIGIFAIVLDLGQIAPWKSFFYEYSISLRGDYWRAAIKIATDNPIFGVGPDGYRDNYRAYRDLVTAMRPNRERTVDSAHNIILDLATSGGFVLAFLFVILQIFVLVSIYKLMKRRNLQNSNQVALVSCWLAWFAQSMISINHIGLAIWGWAFSGAVIGFERRTRGDIKLGLLQKFSLRDLIVLPAGLCLGVIVGVPPFVADSNFRKTIESGEIPRIEKAFESWPKSTTRMVLTSKVFREQGFYEKSLYFAEKAVEFNPASYEAWRELSEQPQLTEDVRAKVNLRLKQLDPLGSRYLPQD